MIGGGFNVQGLMFMVQSVDIRLLTLQEFFKARD